MSKKKRASRQKESHDRTGGGEAASPAGAMPGKLPVIVALSGLAVLAFVLLTTESPQRRSAPVPTLTDLDRWQAAPEVSLSMAPDGIMAMGPEDAPVTIVEFSDFECPYCKDANGVLKNIVSRYPGKIRLVFKNYPLDTSCNEYVEQPVHLYACKAAVMARCAGEQGRFWEMHDAIYGVNTLSMSALDALPDELGLTGEDFATCVEDEATMRRLRADIDEGNRLGVRGTPAIFVNGKQAASFRSNTLVRIIDHILAE